ncbi:tyrosine-type recombinase/integrase [Chloroflexota bacterium]
MMRGTQATEPDSVGLESAIGKLRVLPRESQAVIASLIDRLAEAEGVSAGADHRPPIENLPLWVTKLKSERKSERTISLYSYLAERFLKQVPSPTRADVREYLARRIEETSPSSAETERKALASLFSFLHAEGLWCENPLEGVRHIGPRWGESERRCPSVGDVERVLEEGCLRAQDSLKMRTVIVLLATTGLRLTECMSLRKDGVDMDARELRVLGKGGRRRVVPLLESTAEMLAKYLEGRPSDSPYVFPGNTGTGYAEIYNVEKTLRRACVRAGVEPFTPHQLRHLYATEMLRNGAKLEVVGRILGHSSIGITADVYRHVRTGEMHEEHSRYAPMNGAHC